MGKTEENRSAILFDSINNFSIPVVVGAIGASYRTYAASLGIEPKGSRREIFAAVRKKWEEAYSQPIEPILVASGVCKENIIKGEEVSTRILPAPVWTPQKDAGSAEGLGYITAGSCITKDPNTGIRNSGIYRIMLRKNKDELTVCTHPSAHAIQHIAENQKNDRPTEIAVVLGPNPSVSICSATRVPYGDDELRLASSLDAEPLKLVKCETIDIEVPWNSEIVLEGILLHPKDRPYEVEGPFGEVTGYMGSATFSAVMKITAITHRNDPIFPGFLSQKPPSESSKIRQMGLEAMTFTKLTTFGIQGVTDISMPEAGQAAFIIVAIKKQHPGHPMQVANAVFSILQPRYGKFVVITDDDVDVHDLDDVIWAIVFRTSLTPNRRHVSFIEGLASRGLDYSAASSMDGGEVGIKEAIGVVIDATKPYKPYPLVSLPPIALMMKVRDDWESYGLGRLDRDEIPECLSSEEQYIREGLAAMPKKIHSNI